TKAHSVGGPSGGVGRGADRGDPTLGSVPRLTDSSRPEATVEDIISTVHAHPTMHEAVHEAALAADDRLIHG
ncbi:MAG: hypothetical protein QF351_04245, partial [Phycisphaerales bacterium]|nr:hypothetical protein [Phycisphaerales bacterium]